ncbi:MAG: response regulator [Desulfuromonadales bacterium]|nr:response regulator [Desulfuromonadales bacterium]
MKILIVEENTRDRRLLRSALEQHGCIVIEAEDGLEGLDLAIHHQPDVIISNTLMPRMDGFQLLWALKADPKLTLIPFLFYSDTYTGEQETKLALSLGASAFVVKQDNPEAIWEKTSALVLSEKNDHGRHVYPAIDKSDSTYLWEYSRITATKLEEKVRELEESLIRRRQDANKLRSLNAELTREIAEHQRAEESIREQELELASIFEVAPFLLLLLDGNRKIRRANTYACTFTGTSVTDIIGKRGGEALRCLHALDALEGCGFGAHCRQCVIRLTVINTFDTGQSHHGVEASLPLSIHNLKKTISLLLSTTRITVGNQDMVLLSVQDITAQKALEFRLDQAWKMESLTLLTVGMAQEFNNLLPPMIGYGNSTDSKDPANDPARDNVDHFLNAAKRFAHLTHELHLCHKTYTVDNKCIDLNEPIRSVENDLVRIGGQQIICTMELSQSPLPVFADSHQIELLAKNLAENARNIMPQGGSLNISTARTSIDNEFITEQGFGRPGEYALLSATATGWGMNKHHDAFEPFLSRGKTFSEPGFGLALINCIVHQCDGFVYVMSDTDQGTSIRSYLPLSMPEKGKKTEKPDQEQLAKGKETILLAEDDESVRNMAVALLQHFGYEVIVAIDGDDAIHKFHEYKERINLLLFDLIMPKKSGKAAYDEIRKLNPDIKVLFASGFIPEITKQKKLAGDNVAFIFKPYLPTVFLQKVRNILDGA